MQVLEFPLELDMDQKWQNKLSKSTAPNALSRRSYIHTIGTKRQKA
jgi:hypothetical protein